MDGGWYLKNKGHEAENLRTGILEQCGMVITNLPRSDQYSTQLVRIEGYNEEMYRSKATKPLLRTLARKSTRRKPYDTEKRSEWLWISSKTSDKAQLISILTTAEGQIVGRVGTAAQTPTTSERRGIINESARDLGQPPIHVMSETSFCNIQL